MSNRTTLTGLALALTLAVPIGAVALNNATAIKQAGSLANGGHSALRVGYDGDICKGACADEPLAHDALRPNALKSALGHESNLPMTPSIPTPESGARKGDFGDYYGAPQASSSPANAGAPLGALVGSLVGGLGGMLLAKFL